MTPMQVALVEIVSFGSDVAVYLNGEYIASADPSAGEDPDTIRTVAANLAAFHNTDITRIAYPAEEDWQWYTIEEALKRDGRLAGGLTRFDIAHTIISDAGETVDRTLPIDAACFEDAVQQLIAHYDTRNASVINIKAFGAEDARALMRRDNDRYELLPKYGAACTVNVANAEVTIRHENSGLSVVVTSLFNDDKTPLEASFVSFEDCANKKED